MFATALALICLVLAVPGNCKPRLKEDNPISWPSKYTVQARRIIINARLVQDMKLWRTSTQSREDYNKGETKSLVINKTNKKMNAKKYEIHPKTDYDEDVETTCSELDSDEVVVPKNILPDVTEVVEAGTEKINDKECTKFVYETVINKEFTWAFYNKTLETWVPVRYEIQTFDDWTEGIEYHELWDFEDFDTNFDERSIFGIADDDCPDTVKHKMDDESVTQHLKFIDPENKYHVDHIFKRFQKDHNKRYTQDERSMRKKILQRNMRLIQMKNRQNLGFKLAVNKFSDRTPEEMKRYMGLRRRQPGEVGTHPFPYDEKKIQEIAPTLPAQYDLRTLGLVTYVKNQLECGSCYTFGTTAAAEGALARTNGGRLMNLANQAVVDCSWAYDNGGCDGGSDTAAYRWMMDYGLPTEEEYGLYTNSDGVCNIMNMTKLYKIRGFVDVTAFSENALKVAIINHGPLSVSIHATDAFSSYRSGVFYDISCTNSDLNHEVTLVGYGHEQGDTYWIIKNSWGPEWGIDGYMYISARDNNCGIDTEPTYVIF